MNGTRQGALRPLHTTSHNCGSEKEPYRGCKHFLWPYWDLSTQLRERLISTGIRLGSVHGNLLGKLELKRDICVLQKWQMCFRAGSYKLMLRYWLFRHLLGNREKQHTVLIAQAFSLPINGPGISRTPDPERHQYLFGSSPELIIPWGTAESRNGVRCTLTHQEGYLSHEAKIQRSPEGASCLFLEDLVVSDWAWPGLNRLGRVVGQGCSSLQGALAEFWQMGTESLWWHSHGVKTKI